MAQTVIVSRSGNARTRRASIDGVSLNWEGGDTSKPKRLSAGRHVFRCFVEGKEGDTWAFWFDEPDNVLCAPNGTLDNEEWDEGRCVVVIS